MLQRKGFPTHSPELIRSFIGKGIKEFVMQALPEHVTQEVVIKQCYDMMEEEYAKRWKLNTKLYPGISILLDTLTEKNIYRAIVSNKEDAFTKEIVSHCLSPWTFDAVVGGSFDIPPKPDPTNTNAVIAQTTIPKSDWLYVGDSIVDYETAQNAGLDFVLVRWGYQQAPIPANVVTVNEPQEILSFCI